MAHVSTLPGTSPTPGQLALAQAIAEGATRPDRGVTHVPTSVYTDPAHWAREKALMFDRAPQVLCPSALLPQSQHGSAARCHRAAAAGFAR